MQFPLPQRINLLPEPERERATARFHIRLAALYHNDTGALGKLSTALGMHEKSLANCPAIQGVTAIAMEDVIGDPAIDRKTFRPDLFSK